MIFKNLFGYRHFFSTGVRRQLFWKFNNEGAEVHLQDNYSNKKLAFHALPNIKFSLFFIALGIDQRHVIFPQGVNSETQIVNFLMNNQTPKAIEIKRNSETLFLRNKACDSITTDIIQTLRDPSSIYQAKKAYEQRNNPKSFIEMSNYLIRYYLKLQSEGYCKLTKTDTKGLLTTKIKQDLLHYLNNKNQINCQTELESKLKEQALIEKSISETQLKLSEIYSIYENRENWYKRLAILITLVHLVSFGYMIFFVDWLGWDIIEPLTYTVGVIYTLIGIRFYRKYAVNRSSETIKEALFKIIMPAEKKVLLKSIESRLQVQKKQLKKIEQEQLLLNNRLAYRTSLIQSIQKMI